MEYSLHIWYSAFLPDAYWEEVLPFLMKVWKDIIPDPIALTSNTTLRVDISGARHMTFLELTESLPHPPADAITAFHKVMFTDVLTDQRHQYLSQLEPSHRLALDGWRRNGLVMPFGAATKHLKWPNPWLFSDEKSMLCHGANPLESWE